MTRGETSKRVASKRKSPVVFKEIRLSRLSRLVKYFCDCFRLGGGSCWPVSRDREDWKVNYDSIWPEFMPEW